MNTTELIDSGQRPSKVSSTSYNIFKDSYGEIAHILDTRSLYIDYRNDSFINSINIDNTDIIIKLSNDIRSALTLLKGRVQDDVISFFKSITYSFDEIDVNNFSINAIRLRDYSIIKYITSNNDVDMSQIGSYIDYRQLLSRLDDTKYDEPFMPDQVFVELYRQPLNEYQQYIDEIKQYSDSGANYIASLYNNYMVNVTSSNNELLTLLSIPMVNIEDVCYLYVIIDTYLRRYELNIDIKKNIEYFQYILSLYITQYGIRYKKQVENDILIVDPHILYDKYGMLVINDVVALKALQDDVTSYDIISLAFGALCNENTKHIISLNEILEQSDILDRQANDYISLKREANILKIKDQKLQILISKFTTLLDTIMDTSYGLSNMISKSKQEVKDLFLSGIKTIDYTKYQDLEKFIMRDVLFKSDNPTIQSIFIEKLYEDNDVDALNDYHVYNVVIIKTVIEIIFYNIELLHVDA